MNKRYSETIHDAAIEWGFKEIPGRSLIDPGCNLYVEQPIPLCEEINCKNAHIGIFQLNGRWGCEVGVSLPSGSGMGYKSFLGFCEPHKTRQKALAGAVEEIFAYIHRDVPMTQDEFQCVRWLDEWCSKLLLPKQLRMEI